VSVRARARTEESKKKDVHEQQFEEATGCRKLVTDLIMSQNFEMFAGFVILGNFIVIILETDARATLYDHTAGSAQSNKASDMLSSCDTANFAFLLFYAMECLVRAYALREEVFQSRWNIFDMIIVVVGGVVEVLERLETSSGSSIAQFQVLRTLRMLRLLRAARVIISFKELYSLICGMSSCMRTLLWAAALVFLMLSMWSIIAVEYLHTLVTQLAKDGFYDDCNYCSQSFQSIMFANLTFFQIVSGDGWSELARPLIVHHPWTAVLFVGVIFTMVFGMLNLITAVIVDTAAQARESDVLHMAAQKDYERKFAFSNFARICVGMDTDKDGNITIEELRRGTKEIAELNAYLSVMGVEDADLQLVFDMLDHDHSGKIPIGEFTKQLYKIQTHEHRTTHCFVKHHVETISKHVKVMADLSEQWSRQASEDLCAGEPDAEPKLPGTPPWMLVNTKTNPMPEYYQNENTGETTGACSACPEVIDPAVESPDDAVSNHYVMVLPQCGTNEESDENVESCNSNQLGGQEEEDENSSSPSVPIIPRSRSKDSELEFGRFLGIDLEVAVAQYQRDAFPVMMNAPVVKGNFAQKLSTATRSSTQTPQQPIQGNPLPILLNPRQQVMNARPCQTSLKATTC